MTEQSTNPFTLVDIHIRVDEDGPVQWYALHPQQHGYSMERLLEAQREQTLRDMVALLWKEQVDEDTWEAWMHEADKWIRWKMRELGIEVKS